MAPCILNLGTRQEAGWASEPGRCRDEKHLLLLQGIRSPEHSSCRGYQRKRFVLVSFLLRMDEL
jgi:hypothetical protein